MPATLGMALLVVLILAAMAVVWRRGFSLGRLALCLFGTLIGGAAGAIPGAYLWIGRVVVSATGPVPFHEALPGAIFCLGAAAGALAGLLAIDWVTSRRRPPLVASLTGLAGFVTAAAFFLLAALLVQRSWAEGTFLILSPLAIAAATVAGYSVPGREN